MRGDIKYDISGGLLRQVLAQQPHEETVAATAQAADRLEVCSPPPCLASGLGEGADDGTGSTASNCVITLNNGTALFLREMNRSLALVRGRAEPEVKMRQVGQEVSARRFFGDGGRRKSQGAAFLTP